MSTVKEGQIIISDPFLQDDFFKRTVILITEHNENGTIGFILNRYTDILITEAVPDFPTFDKELYWGGPVEQEVMFFLHNKGNALSNSIQINSHLFWGGDFDELKTMVLKGEVEEHEIQFYLGYAGWAPGQLEAEIEKESWVQGEFIPEYFLDDSADEMWRNALLKTDHKHAFLANFSETPSMN